MCSTAKLEALARNKLVTVHVLNFYVCAYHQHQLEYPNMHVQYANKNKAIFWKMKTVNGKHSVKRNNVK